MGKIPMYTTKNDHKSVDKCKSLCYTNCNGALAQLGAHNTGSVGVTGSNPVCSTKRKSVHESERIFVCITNYLFNERSHKHRRD